MDTEDVQTFRKTSLTTIVERAERDDGEDGENFEGEEDEDDFDEEDDAGGSWLDVRELKGLSLEDLKSIRDGNQDPTKKSVHPITKIVVRRLPPHMTLKSYLAELPEMPKYNYIRLIPTDVDLPSSVDKRTTVYINFESEQEAFWFKEKYNNMELYDEKGNSYIACVDFSFDQSLSFDSPVSTSPPPDKILEESEIYKEFLKAYEEDPMAHSAKRPEELPTPEVMLEEILNRKVIAPESTPLLQFLHEKSEKKDAIRQEREIRRRERDTVKRKLKEETMKRKQREKEEVAKRKQKEREDGGKRKGEDGREPETAKDKRRERDRERQRERDRLRRMRKEKAAAEKREKDGKDQSNDLEKDGLGKCLGQDSRSKGKDGDRQKPASGTVTYSRAGNPTRWSENSGPRKSDKDKNHKDDHKRSQELLPTNSEACDQSKNPSTSARRSNDSEASCSKDTTKSVFGKPFPAKEPTPNKTPQEASSSDQNKKSIGEEGNSESHKRDTGNKPEGEGTKKKVIKRIIRVKKVVRENANAGDESSQVQDGSESKPKKIVRVVKKTSKTDEGSGSKSSTVIVKKEAANNETTAVSTSPAPGLEGKSDAEKERKNRKGRPEIQIYRPGSLRGGASKGSTSTSNSGNKDKSRSSDNVSQEAQSNNNET